jgi:hypothetical protein
MKRRTLFSPRYSELSTANNERDGGGQPPELLFTKTPARREINNIAAAISPPFCYKS